MKSEMIEIDGSMYEVSEIGMDDGFDLMGEEGGVNAPALLRAAVTCNGEKIERNGISLRHAQELMPIVLRINGMEAPAEGED
jgi:hypothetical protein